MGTQPGNTIYEVFPRLGWLLPWDVREPWLTRDHPDGGELLSFDQHLVTGANRVFPWEHWRSIRKGEARSSGWYSTAILKIFGI